MRILGTTARSNQVAGYVTAPRGNVTAAGHRYVINGVVHKDATKRTKRGEAGQS
jgi:hypothetical protein